MASEIHLNSSTAPSDWVVSCIQRLGANRDCIGLSALDLACGGGRHSIFLAQHGMQVLAVDRALPDTARWPDRINFRQIDLESGQWPLQGNLFDVIVVTNYLHRPTFDQMLGCLKSNGVLIYETFMEGNADFGSPRNPDFLLRPNELLSLCGNLNILGFEQGLKGQPPSAVIQRILAVSGDWSAIQSLSKLNQHR